LKKRGKIFATATLVLLAALFFARAPAGAAPKKMKAPVEGYYTVTAEILPILKSPETKYETKAEENGTKYIEYSDDIEGVVVYGNKLNLRPKGKFFELLSPEDGKILGYVPGEGIEAFPEYEPMNGAFYMAAKDAPELSLTPGGRGGKNGKDNLPGRDFSLLKGEVVPSHGKHGGKILLSFSTLDGAEGVGGRFAWADEKDFIALDSYKPDNTKADPKLIPTTRRLHGGNGEEDFDKLPKKVMDSLVKRGFIIDDKPLLPEYVTVDDMADLYSRTAQYEADFITTDIFLHSFHLIFDQALQKFERTFLAPRLKDGIQEAVDTLVARESAFASESQKAFEKAYDMFSVALWLLEGEPGYKIALNDAGAEEINNILAAETADESPVTGQKFDYTLFKPRGHYTISTEFGRYFQAMSYIGLAELPLFDGDGKPITENVATAAIISLALDANREKWEQFEDPIGFLVGAPNAGAPKLYREIVRKHLGNGETAWKKLSDKKVISALAEDIAENIPGPKIQSVISIDKADSDFADRSAVFRISSKRFTYDAYILNRLTSPRVGTNDNPRNMPKGTDVMAVFGSAVADSLSKKDFGRKNYEKNLAELKDEAAGYLAKENTVYASWLEAFRAGFEDSGSEQFFYRSEGWKWKKLATNLASWSELKHDTILYAEQSAAEMGDGGDWYAGHFEPPAPRGYVEPDPQFFDAMLNAASNLLAFIKEYGVENNDADGETNYSERIAKFAELLETMKDAARKEVDKEALSPDEYEVIKQTARAFDAFLLLPGFGFPMNNEELRKMACVADVHTNGFDGTVLETGIGTPRAIYVFANDKSGGARMTKGYVFSYYEFEKPTAERMTDEEWKKIVYDPARAEELESLRPDWYGEFRKNTQ
jgi:hypothetical protein